jgi:sec-independent protein translocase protein TatA
MNTLTLAMLGYTEVLLILAVVLILFGAKKIPELAKGLGSGIKEFKKATRDVQEDLQRAIEDDDPPPSSRRKPPVEKAEPKAEPKSERQPETESAVKD